MDITVTLNRTPRMRWLLPAGCTEWHALTVRVHRNGAVVRQRAVHLRARPLRVIVTWRSYGAGVPLAAEREWTWPSRRPVPGA